MTTVPNYLVTLPVVPYGNAKIAGDTAEEVADRIVAWNRANLSALVVESVAIAEAGAGLAAKVESTPAPAPTPEPAANAGAWGSATPAPPAATPPPASNAGGFPQEKCIHGNRHYWASPDGKAKYWYCPLPKGAEGKCDRVKAT